MMRMLTRGSRPPAVAVHGGRRRAGIALALVAALLTLTACAAADVGPAPAGGGNAGGGPDLLGPQLAALAPQRPGVVDLYFVGFAPEGRQDVFWREMDSVRELMDDRFGAAGRSVVLENTRERRGRVPPATVANLGRALNAVGRLMDPAEDLLFLFASSHGTPDHRLAASLRGAGPIEELDPRRLAGLLDAGGAASRVVVVSACFSGGYVAPLRDERTLVVTAARADRSSFGCATGNAFTYFGEAYFDRALRRETTSFVEAFERAKVAIRVREGREGLSPPSEPQMALGAAIGERLAAYERQLLAGTPPPPPPS